MNCWYYNVVLLLLIYICSVFTNLLRKKRIMTMPYLHMFLSVCQPICLNVYTYPHVNSAIARVKVKRFDEYNEHYRVAHYSILN